MPLMQLIRLTIHDSLTEIVVMAVNAVLLVLVFNLQPNVETVLYPLVLSTAIIFLYLVIKTLRLANFFKRLKQGETTPLPEPQENPVQEKIFESIAYIHNRHLSEIFRLRSLIETRNALFSQFVHNMKSSVAVIELAVEMPTNADNTTLTDILDENKKLKNNLEQSLHLLRLDAFVNDYVPEKIQLAELVKHTINEHKNDFIYARVYPKLNGDGIVYTDGKWCGIIIRQLISNAIKYNPGGRDIQFVITTAENHTELTVSDRGIGIPPDDIPRLFDLFFTGQNGRIRKDSTGIGLFMTKHIADKLGITIYLTSTQGEGTRVSLQFPNLTKM